MNITIEHLDTVENIIENTDKLVSPDKKNYLRALLLNHYSDPRRKYHNLDHIAEVIDMATTICASHGPRDVTLIQCITLAAALHDVRYVPGEDDIALPLCADEWDKLTRDTLHNGSKEYSLGRVLIMSTNYAETMADPFMYMRGSSYDPKVASMIAVLRDADLMGFAKNPYANSIKVIQEAKAFDVPAATILKGRIKFLESLEHVQLFQTPYCHLNYEAEAKGNIYEELFHLKAVKSLKSHLSWLDRKDIEYSSAIHQVPHMDS